MAALEIEQKFVFEMQSLAKKLDACNAKFLGQKTFLDRYYDFPDRKLTFRNIWLRQRQSTWELKSGNNPNIDPLKYKGIKTTEREGKELISKELDKFDFFSNCSNFDAKLSLLQPLAIIETTRTSYRLNDHTKIDLDNARLIPTDDLKRRDIVKYSLGEIEIMVYDDKEIGSSHNEKVENEMKEVQSLLGVETSIKVLSKLDKYFLEYLPDFYKNFLYHT